jgi:hypothetical protein
MPPDSTTPLDPRTLALALEYREAMNDSRNMVAEMLQTFKGVSDILSRTTRMTGDSAVNFEKMAKMSKEVLSNTKIRGQIDQQIYSEIEKSEDRIIQLQFKKIKYSEDKAKIDAEAAQAEIEAEIKHGDFARTNATEQLKLATAISDVHTARGLLTGAADEAQKNAARDLLATALEQRQTAEKSIATAQADYDMAKAHAFEKRREYAEGESYYDEQIAKQKEIVEQNKKASIEIKRQQKFMSHLKDSSYEALGGLGKMINSAKEFSDMIKKSVVLFVILEKLLKFGFERFEQLDKAAENFRKETGFSNTQMVELRANAEAINVEFQEFGVGIEQSYKAAQALTDIFGRTSLITKETLGNVALLAANLGVAEVDSANVLANFQGLGNATQEAAMNVIKVGAGLSEKAGVPFKFVMQDIANVSEQTTALLGANPSKLMKSAIAARALGSDLNKLVSTQRKLLDFSSSVNDELEASALLGRSISFQRARQLAYEGDIEGAARATLDSIKQAGNFNEMNVYQKEALAKASGMELKDITKMLAVEKRRDEIRFGTDQAAKDKLDMQEAALKKIREENDLSKQSLIDEYDRVLMQEKMQGQMTRLKNLMESLIVSIGDILEPIITSLATVIVPLFKIISVILRGTIIPLLKLAAFPLEELGKLLAKGADKLNEWGDSINKFKEESKDSLKYFENGIGYFIKLAAGIAGMGVFGFLLFGKTGASGLMTAVGKVFSLLNPLNLVKNFSAAGKAVGGFFGKIKEGGLRSLFKKSETVPTSAEATVDKTATVSSKSKDVKSGTGIKDFLTNLSKGLKAMGSAGVAKGAVNLLIASPGLITIIPGAIAAAILGVVGKPIETGLKYLSKGIEHMGSTKVLKGALGIAAVGASIIPFAFAMTMFSKVDWGSVGIGTLALIGFTAAAFGLGLLLSTGAGAVIFGAGVIGIAALGAALIPFGLAAMAAGFGITMFGDGIQKSVDPILRLSQIDLTQTAIGIGALGIALAAFGAGSAASGLGSFVGNLLGGDPIAKMEKLASISEKLKMSAEAIHSIAIATSQFGMVDSFAKSIGILSDSLNKLGDSLGNIKTEELAKLTTIGMAESKEMETTTTAASSTMNTSALEAKLDNLTNLLVGGAVRVYLDGKDVSSAMSGIGR